MLGLAGVSAEASFFELGGDSIKATKVVSRANAALGAGLSVRDLFEAPGVAALAARLWQKAPRPALVPQARPERPRLSHAQRRLWFLSKLEGPLPTYNVPMVLRLKGPLDAEALQAAFGDVVARHEVLRTLVGEEEDGLPYQVVLSAGQAQPALEVLEVGGQGPEEAVAGFCRRPFDFASELPIRAALASLGQDEHVFALVAHHIASDGWSMGPLTRDLSAAYRARLEGRAPAWEPLAVQYCDYAIWQENLLASPDAGAAAQLAYWRAALGGLPERTELPTDKVYPAVAGYEGGGVGFEVPAGAHQKLIELARSQGATMFMVAHAALAGLLSRLGAGTDIAIGSPIAGRLDPALDDLVGFFVNTLVLRLSTAGSPSFKDLLLRAPRGRPGRLRQPGPALRGTSGGPSPGPEPLPPPPVPGDAYVPGRHRHGLSPGGPGGRAHGVGPGRRQV